MNPTAASVLEAPAGPVPVTGRVVLIDTLRALALFGVIVMNIVGMVMALIADQVMADATALDKLFALVDLVFLQGKARSTFAFLFGVGFGVLMLRAQARGEPIVPFYLRRMAALLGFGLVNQLFLFWGDILVSYALLGMVLLLMRNWSQAALLRLGAVLIVLPPLLLGGYEALVGPAPKLVGGGLDAGYRYMTEVFSTASYGPEVIAANLTYPRIEWLHATSERLVYEAGVLGLFLLGLAAARRGVLFEVEAHRPLLRRVAWIALPCGLSLSLLHATENLGWDPGQPLAGLVTASFVGLPILALGYVAAFALWLSRHGQGLQRLLAPVGRMALSNYLASGVIGCGFFYAWGAGQLERVSLSDMNLFACGLFAVLTGFSHLWLSRFRHGPAEWLWRRVSYRS